MPPESCSGKELRHHITRTCAPAQSNLTVVQAGKKAPIPSLLPLFSSVKKIEKNLPQHPHPSHPHLVSSKGGQAGRTNSG